jgi:hypothetical protein
LPKDGEGFGVRLKKVTMTEKKPNIRRGEMAFIFAIILGLALGILIKKIRIGLLIGLVLGFMIVLTGWLRTNRR